MKIRYAVETQAGRLWGPFKSAASADKWAKANLQDDQGTRNAYKIRPLHPSR